MTTLAAGNAGNTAEQYANPALFLFEAVSADLHRHTAGNFAHRRQEWQATARIGDRLISNRNRARADQRLGQPTIGGEVKIGEQDLVAPQQLGLLRLRLLDLDDELRRGEDLGGIRQNAGAGALISVIVKADAGAGAGFDDDLMPVMDQFADAARNKADAVFLGFYLFWNTDQHIRLQPTASPRRTPSRTWLRGLAAEQNLGRGGSNIRRWSSR